MHQKHTLVYDGHSQPKGIHLGYPNKDFSLEVFIFLKTTINSEHSEDLDSLLTHHPSQREYLSVDDLKEIKKINDEHKAFVIEYFESKNFTVLPDTSSFSKVACSCTVQDFEKTFNTTIGVFETLNHHSFLAHLSPLCLPSDIAAHIASVSGLSIEERFEMRTPTAPQTTEDQKGGWDYGFSVPDLGQYYDFPEEVEGEGQCIGIIELGGHFKNSDITKYFKNIGVAKPTISVVGTPPKPKSNAANTEVTLDVQIAAALAPKATIIVYYAKTILEALRLVIEDGDNCPTVLSISWAAEEAYYSDIQRAEFDQLLYEAALLGITVIASSGDYGAYNRQRYLNVSMPAAHPYVLGCGGTMPIVEDSVIQKEEVVWSENNGQSASGGGFSNIYGAPEYQSTHLGLHSKRGVPDIAANAGSAQGYQIIFNGRKMVIGGTSASAPLWAALVALLNEKLGYQLGFCNGLLYSLINKGGFNQICYGNNQYYSAGPYWNACTGLGTPKGSELFNLIEESSTNN